MERFTSFGYWVRRQRKARDLTQADLAKQVSCTVSMLKKIERDERRPSRELAILLADQLAIPLAHRESFLSMARGEFVDVPLTAVPPPHPADNLRPLFVGHERELARLASLLERVIGGNGQILFITGEAGQGKTSLMAEFARRAQATYPELVVAAGTCQALSGIADPYLPFRDLLAMLSGDWRRPWLNTDLPAAHSQRLRAIAAATTQAIAAYAPDLVDIIVPTAMLPKQPALLARPLNQRQIFDQTTQLLRALAQRQPLLLLLDDLQWADTASANLLFHLGRQLANSPILIIGAFRPSEVYAAREAEHPLAAVVQELVRYRGDIRMDLDAFVPEEGRNFVDAVLDSEPNRLGARFREALFWRTKGQPLFTAELVRTLQEQGALVRDAGGVWIAVPDLDWHILPARVEAVIARRIDRLPPRLRHLLAVASVEGESFSVEVLAAVQGLEVRTLLHDLSQDLDRRYRLIHEQGVLQLGSHALTRYQFRHNLFQQYLYNQLGTAEQRQLHREIAAALAHVGQHNLADLSVSLAHHYLAAGETAQAVPHLSRAGDEARRRVALPEAVHFYRCALAHWSEENPAAQGELLQKLGEVLLVMGKSQEAIERFADAERLYAQAGNPIGMAAVQRMTGRMVWEQGDRAEALRHYHRALATLEPGPENAEMARAISAISQMHMLADEMDAALEWGERARAMAERLQVEDVIVHALNNLGMALVYKGEADRGLGMLAESQAHAVELGLPHDACRAYVNWGEALLRLERIFEAQAIFQHLLAYALRVEALMFYGVALVRLMELEWHQGHWRAALARREAVLEWMATHAVPSIPKIWGATLLGEIHNDLGQPEQARAILTEYTPHARSTHELQTTVPHLAQLVRASHSESEVAGFLQEMLPLLDAAIHVRYDTIPALRLLCTWLPRGSPGDPAGLDRLLRAHVQMHSRQSAAALHEGQALAAAAHGEWAQALSEYEAAARNWEAIARPYDLLRVLGDMAKALAHTGNTDQTLRERTNSLIERLAAELDDLALQRAFLASPLVVSIRRTLLA